MRSAFQCQEFEFGQPLTDKELEESNKIKLGKKYVDKETKIYKHGSADKKPLTDSPFNV